MCFVQVTVSHYSHVDLDVIIIPLKSQIIDFYRATRRPMHRADYAVARCLSVRLSVTRRYCA